MNPETKPVASKPMRWSFDEELVEITEDLLAACKAALSGTAFGASGTMGDKLRAQLAAAIARAEGGAK